MKTITQYHARRAAARAIRLSALLLSSAVLLAACGGDGGDAPPKNANESDRQSLLYAYPDNGQTEVATPSPIVLRFTSAVAAVDAEAAITLHQGDENGPALPFTAEPVADEPRGIVLTPENDLAPLADYTVTIRDLRLAKGTAADQDLHFTTRALQRGPRSLVIADEAFKVSRTLPNDTAAEPVMDFSTFRFQFTQPIDATTARYGQGTADTVNLVDSIGNLVDAIVLVDGPYLTVDPKPEYLTAGETYTLTLRGGLTSTYGATFASTMISFTPRDSSPRGEPAVLVQRITDSENRTNTSLLTGEPVNEVPVNATLLGENSATQTSGDVLAELADVTIYPDVTPVRIPRDTILTGSNIDVMIGGEVPAGISSGEVKMHFLSDATGYLVPNPYNNVRDDALRIVHLFMDVGIATEDPRANGGFTQDILHIELVGVADVDTTEGTLNIDAVSVVEPDILGQEFGYGVLGFQLRSYKDQINPPAVVKDTIPPVLQNWMPGEGDANLMLPGDPIVLNFSESLDQKTLANGITLTRTDSTSSAPVAVRWRMDGAMLVIEPEAPLRYSTQSDRVSYQLALPAGITDLAGNVFDAPAFASFEMPVKTDLAYDLNNLRDPASGADIGGGNTLMVRAPFVLSVYPGYPCVTDPTTRDLVNDDTGRCAGGHPGASSSYPFDNVPEDDHLPVVPLPADRPIMVSFSKDMMAESIRLGGSFQVNEVADDGTPVATVPGSLEISPRQITFWPDQPWRDGVLYRYTLGSNNDAQSALALCDGSQSLCGVEQALPLQTQLLGEKFICDKTTASPGDELCYADSAWLPPASSVRVQTLNPADTGGGPDLAIFFRGATASSDVLQALRATPVSDLNANLEHDANHTVVEADNITATGRPYYDPRDPNAVNTYMMAPYHTQLIEEPGPTEIDPNADPELDPNGMLPPPNSAKILSLNAKGKDMDEGGMMLLINGANVGCGVSEWVSDDPEYNGTYGLFPACPKEKFTYVHAGLSAEITGIYQPGQGLKVKIWPTRLVTTNFLTMAHMATFPSQSTVQSGPQIMRMRYEEGEDGRRNQPITGWIRSGPDGQPELVADMDLYLDAPWLTSNVSAPGSVHNQNSYLVHMTMSGPIQFMDDGRMLVTQKNGNAVDVNVQILANDGSNFGEVSLSIPVAGSHLQFVSEPIKRLR
jgi:hypothetical protein